MPLQDVSVKINVASPAPKIGLGRPVIFVQKTGAAEYKEYSTLAALQVDYATGTAVEAKAATIFKQDNRPDKVAVATYATDIKTSMALFYGREWHFALVANDLAADQLAAATFISDKDFKFLVVQVRTEANRKALKAKKRTKIYDHTIADEHLDAAAVGDLGSQTVGSITWKFKSLKGVTARYLNETEINAIDADFAVAYIVKGGRGQLSEGWLADGSYIDDIHGQDWIKADMENEISYTLGNAPKIPYDARGIGAIEAAMSTTLQRGFKNGIIATLEGGLPDYTVTTLSRDEVDIQDRALRVYPGGSFSYGKSGAIHEARVTGVVSI
ncbi:DUF3383 family protein [Peribacillus castrilensis]|uniref:DUF3383 family protein n=1 Tax=Peribacillus TaxID=2675229 RepID=UPI0030F56962